ncbi:MAG: nucleotide-binding protein [Candidatus Hydrogenedentes bacterium]|nr:nucleotide-binding protein [Candidatus Hydrogenedentota bacterium]
MSNGQTRIEVFFSWQSDISGDSTTQVIRKCLRVASTELEQTRGNGNLLIHQDEATRNLPGSPNIAESILRKIEVADVFVCDITTINRERAAGARPVPNPNVLYELGFAVAHLGWNRIILLFNEAFGNFDNDVPFDLEGQRITRYSFDPHTAAIEGLGKKEKANACDKMAEPLRKHILEALADIVAHDPPRPADDKESSLDELHKRKDYLMVTEVMSTFPLNMIDDFIDFLANRRMSQKSFFFWESFKGLITSSRFHINDGDMNRCIMGFYRAWGSCYQFADCFHSPNGEDPIFQLEPGDAPLPSARALALNRMIACSSDTRRTLETLLRHIRKHYPKIDLDYTSGLAWSEYQHQNKTMK